MALSHAVLVQNNASTSNAIISAFTSSSAFTAFAEKETTDILGRDAEDATKLQAGIATAVERGVLEAHPPVEHTHIIDVLGKSVDEVCSFITQKLGDAPAAGCVLVLSGLSGTGKGTTLALLETKLPRAVAWSNGNIFRSLTLLALEHCEANNVPLSEAVLTPALLASLLSKLSFGKSEGEFDTTIALATGATCRVSQVANTTLKEARIGKNIPTVAKMSQGEVVKFAAGEPPPPGRAHVLAIADGAHAYASEVCCLWRIRMCAHVYVRARVRPDDASWCCVGPCWRRCLQRLRRPCGPMA